MLGKFSADLSLGITVHRQECGNKYVCVFYSISYDFPFFSVFLGVLTQVNK